MLEIYICLVAVMLGWDVHISCDLPILFWFGVCDLHYLLPPTCNDVGELSDCFSLPV